MSNSFEEKSPLDIAAETIERQEKLIAGNLLAYTAIAQNAQHIKNLLRGKPVEEFAPVWFEADTIEIAAKKKIAELTR